MCKRRYSIYFFVSFFSFSVIYVFKVRKSFEWVCWFDVIFWFVNFIEVYRNIVVDVFKKGDNRFNLYVVGIFFLYFIVYGVILFLR